MAHVLGPVIGAAVDREDGDSGVKGAILGSVLQSAASALATVVVTFAAGWALKKLFASKSEAGAPGEPAEQA